MCASRFKTLKKNCTVAFSRETGNNLSARQYFNG